MTNKERQLKLNKEKWIASESAERDLSGEMAYCVVCKFAAACSVGAVIQSERDKNLWCAKAYNRFVRNK